MLTSTSRAIPTLRGVDVAIVGVPLTLVVLNAVVTIQAPHPSVVTTVMGVLGCLALIWRRERPVEVLFTQVVVSLVPTLGLGHTPDLYAAFVPAIVAFYAIAAPPPGAGRTA